MKNKLKYRLLLGLVMVFNLSFSQDFTVTGVVSGDNDNMPLPGVSVIIKGTSTGVQTDFDGEYMINVEKGSVLVYSFLGMKTQEVVVESSVINVVLAEDAASLDEVVITAYGNKTTLEKNTAAIATVSAETIEDRANASVLQNLQGQVSGLNISTPSGVPGADSTIIIRGQGSINGNIEPIFVVDNIVVDEDNFRSINQNDIETFSVLKDAAAAAVYGSRGANGAIVITTKQGKFNQGLKFSYKTAYGVTNIQNQTFDLLTSNQMLTLEKELGVGRGASLSDAEIDALSKNTNTYWADYFFRTGRSYSHDLSISSGSENTSNFTSLSYFDQEGIFLKSDLKRFNVRNNFNGKSSNDKFNYGASLSMNYSQTNEIDGSGSNATFFNPFSAALEGMPYLSPFDPDGSITIDGGIQPGDIDAIINNSALNFPYVNLNSTAMNSDVEQEVKLLSSFNANYNFAKNLTLGTLLGADYQSVKFIEILNPLSILGPFQADQRAEFGGIRSETFFRDFRFNSLASLNFNKTFDEKHSVDFTAYMEYIYGNTSSLNWSQAGIDPRLPTAAAGVVGGTTEEDLNGDGTIAPGAAELPYIPSIGSGVSEVAMFSYFGILDYDYDGRFGLGASLRRDSSSRFINENKWGTFFSVSGRWNIDKEAFMANSSFNLLKIRASYGTAGNDRILNPYYGALNNTRSLYGIGTGYNNNPSTAASQIGNVNLKWETIAQTNVGVDFGVWNNRLSGTFDVYEKKTTDLFQSVPISLVNATSQIQANSGSMTNKGVEGLLRYTILDKNDLRISVNANGAYNDNKVLSVPGTTGESFGGGSTILKEGEKLGVYYLVPYAGVNPANGNPLFVSADGSLSETFSDADRRITDKSALPTWQGGFGTDIRYKGFEFTTQFVWFADVWLNNLDRASLDDTSGSFYNGRNRSTDVLRAWKQEGDITDIPRIGNPYNSIDYINSVDRYLDNASFLRLRNITLGYSLPDKITDKLGLNAIRFYLQGENLITFSSFKGWDAENGFRSTNRGNYPTPKIVTFGTTINF